MTTLPTYAECAAVPPKKRTALQNMIWDWTHPLANEEDEIPFFRKQLTAVIEEERKERDALAAENERLRKDAERYRWLKADADNEDSSHQILVETVADESDAAIDAALAKEPSQEGGGSATAAPDLYRLTTTERTAVERAFWASVQVDEPKEPT